jgi:hypothetical protein
MQSATLNGSSSAGFPGLDLQCPLPASAAITSATPKTHPQPKRIVDEAIDGGITFFDNCWEYHRSKSENRNGGRS